MLGIFLHKMNWYFNELMAHLINYLMLFLIYLIMAL